MTKWDEEHPSPFPNAPSLAERFDYLDRIPNPPTEDSKWYSICSGHDPDIPDEECDLCQVGHWACPCTGCKWPHPDGVPKFQPDPNCLEHGTLKS